MKIERYQACKASEVTWLGDVSEHWEEKRIKDLSFLQSGINLTSEQIEDIEKYPVYGGNGLRGYFSKYTNEGDYILIGRQGALCGNINYASGKFWATEHAVVVYLKRFVHVKWYGEMLRVMNLNQHSLSAAQPGLSVDRIKRLLLFVPPISEQKSIALYLDNKTAQIDRKVDLLTQKAKLYADLKQSLINETVTRGRDRSVPMKDSAIEWIGEVPEHWEIKHLKSLAEIKGGKDSKEVELEEGEYPIYGSGGIFGRASKYLHEKPSVLLGRKGTIDKPLFVTKPFWSVDTMFYTEIKNGIYPKFFYYQCLTIQFGLYQYGSAVPSMAQNVLRQILFATPPLSEQKEIATYLDTKTAQIDQIIQTINTQIEKLKELRKTLINDVVTGKIKVTED